MTIVDNAVYVDGRRTDNPESLDCTYETLRERGGTAWIGLYRPDLVVTIRHAESPDLSRVRHRLERSPHLLKLGPEAVLYAILDQFVDEYLPVAAGLENDLDEIEDQLFTGKEAVARRIYELSREVIAFQRATHPLVDILEALQRGSDKYNVDLELQRHLHDVLDHSLRLVEKADSFRAHLETALTVHATLVGQQQSEERDELRPHARTSLDRRLPACPGIDACHLGDPVPCLQAPALAVTEESTSSAGSPTVSRRINGSDAIDAPPSDAEQSCSSPKRRNSHHGLDTRSGRSARQ